MSPRRRTSSQGQSLLTGLGPGGEPTREGEEIESEAAERLDAPHGSPAAVVPWRSRSPRSTAVLAGVLRQGLALPVESSPPSAVFGSDSLLSNTSMFVPRLSRSGDSVPVALFL